MKRDRMEDTIALRDLRVGDWIEFLGATVGGIEHVPVSPTNPISNTHYLLSDGRVLLLSQRMAVRCRNWDVKKIISSKAVPEQVLIRREGPSSIQR